MLSSVIGFSVPSIFPQLLTYAVFAPLFLRLALAVSAFAEAREIKNGLIWPAFVKWSLIVSGVCLFFGFLTQAVAALYGLVIITRLFRREKKLGASAIAQLAIIISLLLLGPGVFAVDLPF